MTLAVLDVLDSFPTDDSERRQAWLDEVERSLAAQPQAWLEEVGPEVREDGLAKDRAWVLLSWVEDAASRIASERRSELVELAAFAMSLLEASPLDRRDVMVVAMLVRRASTLAGLPFPSLVRRGCARAGVLGASCEQWLLRITDATPSTHEESGEGRIFVFRRKPSTIDVERLEQRFGRRD